MHLTRTTSIRPAWGRLGAAALLALPLLLVLEQRTPAQDEQDPAAGSRTVLEQWVETERLLSKERRDWVLGRESLNERIGLVQREITSFEERITEAEASIAEADKKREELVAENDRLKAATSSLSETIVELEGRTRSLLVRLPDPIRDRVKPLSQRLPAEGAEVKASLSERFQNVVGILNAVNKFHREITLTTEVRDIGGGRQAEVTAVYLGVSQGYYVSNDGTAAGMGSSGEDGFTWTARNDSAGEIAEAVRILKNEAPARFVRLPITIQ
ncbi:MAG: DUF3450 family protein [Planctomycetes bacterium]|nr:DUF3450 family protein [Planctomycetota bacterium]MDA0946974.1 DUF3450 family protein [Planctomycetota bacterium]